MCMSQDELPILMNHLKETTNTNLTLQQVTTDTHNRACTGIYTQHRDQGEWYMRHVATAPCACVSLPTRYAMCLSL